MRAGIVGFGKMGMLHGALLNKLEGVELYSIADTSKIVLHAFKSIIPSIKYYNSYEKMIDECNLDVVIIATPSFLHVPIAKYALERKANVFIEKPLSNNLEQAEELMQKLKGTDLVTMVGFCMRYISTFAKAKEIIDSNQLGKIETVNSKIYIADVFGEQKGWRYNKKISGGGVLTDFAVHMVDLLYYYFGEIASVKGQIKSIYSKEVEDEVQAEFIFKNGIKAKMDSSWSKQEYRKTYAKIEINGSKGSMVVTDQTISLELKDPDNKAENKTTKMSYPELYEGYFVDIGGPLYSTQMEKFIDAVKNKKKLDADADSGYYVQKIVDLIYKSAEQNKELFLNGDDNNA